MLADLGWEQGIILFNQVAGINNLRQGDLPNLAVVGRGKDVLGPVNVSVALYDKKAGQHALGVYSPGATDHWPEILRVLHPPGRFLGGDL
ncbi:hypothetical protein CcaCcLH18_12032 [Colletotrichum camelliae]|nr:hypothetical protein CcaCcLH18_12032 [Colletotrichum camelliae]